MKIVLLKEVAKLGHAGDIKEVAEGYARNFLIPQGLAADLNRHTLNMLQAQKRKRERLKVKAKTDKAKLSKRIDQKSFTMAVKTDDKGTLYAGLDAGAIALEIVKQGFPLEASDIILKAKIKKTGSYDIKLKLAGTVAAIKLEVKALDGESSPNT